MSVTERPATVYCNRTFSSSIAPAGRAVLTTAVVSVQHAIPVAKPLATYLLRLARGSEPLYAWHYFAVLQQVLCETSCHFAPIYANYGHHCRCTSAEIRAALAKTAVKPDNSTGRDQHYGYGIIQAKAAHEYLKANPCNRLVCWSIRIHNWQ